MKKLSLYLFLLLFALPTPSQADDISDFEIEGMSVGDSLLDHMTEKEIKNSETVSNFTSKEYREVKPNIKLSLYDQMSVGLKDNDKDYIIQGIIAVNWYKNKNMKDCISLASEIADKASVLFENTQLEKKTFPHLVDKTGKTTNTAFYFMLKDESNLRAVCVDYGPEQEKIGKVDHLNVGAVNGKYNEWLVNFAYK